MNDECMFHVSCVATSKIVCWHFSSAVYTQNNIHGREALYCLIWVIDIMSCFIKSWSTLCQIHNKYLVTWHISHQIFGDMAYFNWKPCECYSYFSRWVGSLQHCQWQMCDLAFGYSMFSIFSCHTFNRLCEYDITQVLSKAFFANTYSQFWEKTSLEMGLVWITWPF